MTCHRHEAVEADFAVSASGGKRPDSTELCMSFDDALASCRRLRLQGYSRLVIVDRTRISAEAENLLREP